MNLGNSGDVRVCNVLFYANKQNLHVYPTVVASMVRRTKARVWVKILSKRYKLPPFEVGNLRVEFHADSDFDASVAHTDDRLNVADILRVAPEWQDCIVLCEDQLFLCDVEAWARTPMDHRGIHFLRPRLPEWEGSGESRGFGVGPPAHPYRPPALVDLEKMRGLVELASDDRCQQIPPRLLSLEEERSCDSYISEECDPYSTGIGEYLSGEHRACVVHWIRRKQPGSDAKAVGSDLWSSEFSTWEALRLGAWAKPAILEVMPDGYRHVLGLAARGWSVEVLGPRFPEARVIGCLADSICSVPAPDSSTDYDLVRFGSGAMEWGVAGTLSGVSAWLRSSGFSPKCVSVCSPFCPTEIAGLSDLGYAEVALADRRDWPAGGSDPDCLDFSELAGSRHLVEAASGERNMDVYFRMHPERQGSSAGPGISLESLPVRTTVNGVSRESHQGSPLLHKWRVDYTAKYPGSSLLASINVVFSVDDDELVLLPISIHSIVRRTIHPVHVICYVAGEIPEDFYSKNLLVEFVPREAKGSSDPEKSPHPSQRRGDFAIHIVRDHPWHWDRCWIFSVYQIAVADLAKVFWGDFRGKLLKGVKSGRKLGQVFDIPESLAEVSDLEDLLPGMIIDLDACRKSKIWERLEAHRDLLGDQWSPSLIAAAGELVEELPVRWDRLIDEGNIDADFRQMFPQIRRPFSDFFEGYGVLNFSGVFGQGGACSPFKRSRIWHREHIDWSSLRRGDWDCIEREFELPE